MKTARLRHLASKVADAVAEMNYAQRRLFQLRLSMDRYLIEPDAPPATYDEFLARTAGVLLREPSASLRAQRSTPR